MKPSHFLGELKVLTKLAATHGSKVGAEVTRRLQYVAYCSAERSDAEFVQMHFGGEFVNQNNLGQWSRANGGAFDRNLICFVSPCVRFRTHLGLGFVFSPHSLGMRRAPLRGARAIVWPGRASPAAGTAAVALAMTCAALTLVTRRPAAVFRFLGVFFIARGRQKGKSFDRYHQGRTQGPVSERLWPEDGLTAEPATPSMFPC